MQARDWLQYALFIFILTALTPLVGTFLAGVFDGKRTFLTPALGRLERWTYRLCGIDHNEDMDWKTYAKALMIFNAFGILFVCLVQMIQAGLPLNPQTIPNVPWHSALNTAVSFVTNTNWQGYSGETTMSYLTQMLALAVQNFLSAAVGLAVALALTRGILRRQAKSIGNFWVDLTRSVLFVLLPLSLLMAVFLMGQGGQKDRGP